MKRMPDTMEWIFPPDGVMLTDAVGEPSGSGLKIEVKVDAARGRRLLLNGQPLPEVNDGFYVGTAILQPKRNRLEVRDADNGQVLPGEVWYLPRGDRKYRISLDDNIWFLQNLTLHTEYRSMFEDPYLALLKEIHEKFGTKFHVNLYYETPRLGGFNLTQMTDRFKPEWRANSGWLRLCFHANADKPNRPYAHVTYDQMYREAERVNREILRFAGEEAFTQTVMTVHFGDCSLEGARALRDLGYLAFVGTFKWKSPDGVDIRMYCNERQCLILQKYGFYYDRDEDITLFRYNGGIQHIPPEAIRAQFDRQAEECPAYTFKDICLHEQYFYPEYPYHQNTYREKLTEACGWCAEHGYEPIFMDELFEFNSHEPEPVSLRSIG